MKLTAEEVLLLLWIVVRENGVVPNVSALHADILMPIKNVSYVADRLGALGLIRIRGTAGTYEPTDAGRIATRRA